MPILRYVGGMPVVLLCADGRQIELEDGREIELTEAETRGCACRPERGDGVWERVKVFGVTETPETVEDPDGFYGEDN